MGAFDDMEDDSGRHATVDDALEAAAPDLDGDSACWESAKGTILIAHMETSHIENAMGLLVRRGVVFSARMEKLAVRAEDTGRPWEARIADEIEIALILNTTSFPSVGLRVKDVRRYRTMRRELRKRRTERAERVPPPRRGPLSAVDVDSLL